MKKSIAELQELLHNLQIERDEELQQYQEKVARLPLPERRKNGACWYPLQLVEQGYGIGEYAYMVVTRTRELQQPHQFRDGPALWRLV